MCRDAREQCRCTVATEQHSRKPSRRRQRDQRKARQEQRVTWDLERPERISEERLPTRHEWVHQSLPDACIRAELVLHGSG